MHPNARRSLSAAALLLALAAPAVRLAAQNPPAPSTAADTDAKADQVAAQALDAMGGKQAWDNTHYLHWTFAGRRTHTWDKWSGQHRVEGEDKEHHKYVVIENLNTHDGKAWLDGKPVSGDAVKPMLENAYGAWVNDSYWLIMPYKLKDPGVHLTYAGEETLAGKPYDKLHLSFGKVGLTPGDEYWAWFDKSTHLMDRWAFHLESMKADEPASPWDWTGWQRYGKVMLAPHRTQVSGGDRKLELGDIAISDSVPASTWTAP
ncbi:MAG: hypothetical protein QOJ16_88 [Acidobacteriota bacterium]|jgi:hypothetical protein|nr:hypothetical protein [Acidobacteriota bacterium]